MIEMVENSNMIRHLPETVDEINTGTDLGDGLAVEQCIDLLLAGCLGTVVLQTVKDIQKFRLQFGIGPG